MPTPQRLPIVNSDDGQWGSILRQYLQKEHYDDGTDNPVNGGHKTVTIRAGSATAGTAPLKLTSGTLLTTPEVGAIEFLTDSLYLTVTTGTVRRTIAAYDDSSGATGDIYYRNSSGVFTRLGIGSSGNVLTVTSGLPAWGSGGGSGTVTTVSVVSANGLAGSVANATTTPAITLSTSVTGLLKGNGTAISAAAASDLPSGIDHHTQLTNFTANDDHTQYALLAGRSGGQSLIGGTGSSDILSLKGSSNASLGTISVLSRTNIFPADATYTSDVALGTIQMANTYTLNFASAHFGGGATGIGIIAFNFTTIAQQSEFTNNGGRLFQSAPTYTNLSSVAANLGAHTTLDSRPTFQADTQSITTGPIADIFSRMSYNTINSGTLTSGSDTVNFEAALTVGTGATVTPYEGFVVLAPTVTGTLTNMTAFQVRTMGSATNTTGLQIQALTSSGTNIGVDIAAPTTGTTNIGLRNKGQTQLGSSAQLVVDTSGNLSTSGGLTTTGSGALTIAGTTTLSSTLTAAAGTTAIAPLVFTSGTNLTSAAAGAMEFDGTQIYGTIDTTSGRGAIPAEQYFRLAADGSTISTIANFFGTTSNISLVANAYYEIEIFCWFLNTTAGTVTWTFTNSAAPTNQNIHYRYSPVAGVNTGAGGADYLEGDIVKDATATKALTVSGTLTTAVNHYAHFKMLVQNGTGTSLKIQATKAVGGTITPRAGSYWKARRLPANSTGTFAA